MNGRQRLDAILHRRPADRLSWTSLVDDNTLAALPPDRHGLSLFEFYRYLGCDILQWNSWGAPCSFRSPRILWPDSVKQDWRKDDNRQIHEVHTPNGTLSAVYRAGHPVKYMVETLEELRLYRSIWEGVRYEEADDREAFRKIDEAIGSDGVIARTLGPSTIPLLLENIMGTVNFYYLLNDHPAEVEALIQVVHERELEAWRIAARGPGETFILVENTDTRYISPKLYRRYNGPHVREFVSIMHAAGKIAIIHMCGHIRDLLHDIRETGLDGVHALTPPPVGDTPWELALDVLGEETVIVGAFNPAVFVPGPPELIERELELAYTRRLRQAHFVLCTFADGLAVPLDHFQAVARWFGQHG